MAGLLGVVACGDPLLPAGFRGEPILTFQGVVREGRFLPGFDERLDAAVVWQVGEDDTPTVENWAQQFSAEVRVDFPATFTFNIFDRPRDPRLSDHERQYEIGRVIVYADTNDNARFDDGELRGLAQVDGLLYTEHELTKDESPTGSSLEPGLQLVRLPLPCAPIEITTSTGAVDDCGANLGAPCLTSADCGRVGLCVSDFPGGLCVLPEGAGCVQIDAAPESFLIEDEGPAPITEEVFFPGCLVDADCREEDGYECIESILACIPLGPIAIDVGVEFEPAPFCFPIEPP